MDWIYETDKTGNYRYSLGKKGKKTLICIGVNPSQAKPEQYDGTVSSVERIALNNQFDSWIMLNLYPQRSADAKLLHHKIEKKYHEQNLEIIESYLEEDEVFIWAAWGNLIDSRPFLKHCLSDIFNMSQFYDCQWLSAGEHLKAGHPRHPLYLKKTTILSEFDMEHYMETVIQPEDDRF
ncbi:DUF1643 domain-containing protein [Marivirga harenae]|uniref:DUF1643 domain-containing protein n=1 Tax=Marivirga harenae TaxID=2010992 RepID=UPI0026DF828E|nr:DUF1643 domain-containing protein [Marivirga harenae]WKV11231.1 DUF1643 domain-containing protein [Marivirga harenae]|tara:strand:- start:113104 stop:113640 length:537 start_codon:yes stop_codon:yes gene_type:complete